MNQQWKTTGCWSLWVWALLQSGVLSQVGSETRPLRCQFALDRVEFTDSDVNSAESSRGILLFSCQKQSSEWWLHTYRRRFNVFIVSPRLILTSKRVHLLMCDQKLHQSVSNLPVNVPVKQVSPLVLQQQHIVAILLAEPTCDKDAEMCHRCLSLLITRNAELSTVSLIKQRTLIWKTKLSGGPDNFSFVGF